MTSKLILYKNCKIIPQKNMKVDNISTYLSTFTDANKQEYDNFQYQKIELDMFIKVPIGQDKQVDIGGFNYCSITQDTKTYYFFILNANWISETVLQLEISMDTINSISHTFSNKTQIIRQHKARFLGSDRLTLESNNTLHQVVDKIDEGVTPALMIKDTTNSTTITETGTKQNQNWYLVYRTMPTDDETGSTPLDVYLLPKNNNVPYADGYTSTVTWYPSDLQQGVFYYFPDESICYKYKDFETIAKYQFDINNGIVQVITVAPIDETSSVTFTQEKYYYIGPNNQRFSDLFTTTRYTIKAGTEGIAYLNNIDTIDRSLSSIVSIIELPYLPNNISWNNNVINLTGTGWEIKENKIHLINYTSEFERNIATISIPMNVGLTLEDTYKVNKNKLFESKLKHSSLYQFKLCYDDNVTGIAYERIERTGNTPPSISVSFKPTNSVTSELMFHWTFNNGTYKEVQDYETYLSSTRNNQLGLYTSQWLDYIRTGLSWDRLAQKQQNTKNAIITGVQVAGGIIMTVAGGPVGKATGIGMIISSVSTTTNAIAQTIQSEQQIQQKLAEYSNQASSINNANAVDLFNYYSGNKLRKTIYTMSEQMQNQMFDLFYYNGYAVNNKGIPSTNDRMWFNYVQCEPVFESVADSDFVNDLKERYKIGVTVYHNVDGEYDWEQQYENWENFLFN